MRNGDGYRDPTATKAIFNLSQPQRKPRKPKAPKKKTPMPKEFDSVPAWTSDDCQLMRKTNENF